MKTPTLSTGLMPKQKTKGFGGYNSNSNATNLQFPTSFTNKNSIVPPQPRKSQFNSSDNDDYSKNLHVEEYDRADPILSTSKVSDYLELNYPDNTGFYEKNTFKLYITFDTNNWFVVGLKTHTSLNEETGEETENGADRRQTA